MFVNLLKIAVGIGLIVGGGILEIMWLGFLFGSVLGVVLVLIFAPHLLVMPWTIGMIAGMAVIGSSDNNISIGKGNIWESSRSTLKGAWAGVVRVLVWLSWAVIILFLSIIIFWFFKNKGDSLRGTTSLTNTVKNQQATPIVSENQNLVATTPAKIELNVSSDPVPVCKAGDGRIEVPVWQPKVNEEGNLSSDPPQKDGLIVYIKLYQDASKVTCNDKELNSFSLPKNPKDVMEGGLAVDLRGNTQFANGFCYFSGYYMNEDVMGIHQGWIETYFGAIEKKEVIMSGKYCLSKAIN